MKNYYQILDLEPGCNSEQIKAAFKKYAKHFHPDKHGGNDEFFTKKFIEVQDAYDCLINQKTRDTHDEYHGLNHVSSTNYFHKSSQDSSYSNGSSQNSNDRNRTNSNGNFNNTQVLTEEHYCGWAEQKLNSNDYEGAIELIGEGMKKFPNSGSLYFAEGQIQEAFGFYIRALKSYKKAFEKGFIPAKDGVIKIESILKSAIDVAEKHQLNGILFCFVGVVITVIAQAVDNLTMGVMIGTAVNFVGAIFLSRRMFNELPKQLVDSLGFYSVKTNIFSFLLVVTALVSSPITAYLVM